MTTLGLVGVGNWGRKYLETSQTLRTCRIKYICTKTAKTLSEFPSEYIKTTNYKDLLRHRDLEGVIIATPPSIHIPIAIDFLTHNIPVLIEKPVATSLTDSMKLREVAIKHDCIVMGGHVWLYDFFIQEIINQSSAIGPLRYVDIESYNTGIPQKDIPLVWDWLPHHISFCNILFRSQPIKIDTWRLSLSSNNLSAVDRVAVRMQYINTIQVFLKAGWMSPIKSRLITLVGDHGALIYTGVPNPQITLYRYDNPQSEIRHMSVINKIPPLSILRYSPLKNELLVFLEVIRNRTKPISDIDHISMTTDIVEQIQKKFVYFG